MADALNWGILATGSIARQFAGGLKVSKTGRLAAVGSRTLETAEKFTASFGGKPLGSYEEVLADASVDAVYIATPHHMHEEWTIKCARAGKAILCEKPFTLNEFEAKRALEAVKRADVFFMEAFMYRCAEQTQRLMTLLGEGAIGQVLNVTSEFGFNASRDWTNFRGDGRLGGGALMDVGGYCVSFARLVAGSEPESVHYAAEINQRGYDSSGSGSMKFAGELSAHFGTAVHLNLQNDARVYGTEGWIRIKSPWKVDGGTKMTLFRYGKDEEEFSLGVTNDQLYAGEADAVARFMESKECPFMSVQDTLGQVRTMDRLRESAGLHFELEAKA